MPAIGLADGGDKAPTSGRSSGGRGCGTSAMPVQSQVPALILLTPNGQQGQTVSTRPTFAWFVRDAEPLPLEFRLYEQEPGDSAQSEARFTLIKEIKDDRLRSTPGIMVLSPTTAMPELMVGKRYRWQVELVCDSNRPSSNLFAESVVEVVPMQPQLQRQLAQTSDRVEKARLYAQANLWYDVLKTAFITPADTTKLQALRLSLLNSVAIDATERKLLQDSAIQSIQR